MEYVTRLCVCLWLTAAAAAEGWLWPDHYGGFPAGAGGGGGGGAGGAGGAGVRIDTKVRLLDQPPNDKADAQVDGLQFCKCVSNMDCNPRYDGARTCGSGKYLCCFKKPNKQQLLNTEFFNEVDDERPMLFPSQERLAGPFPSPPNEQQAAAADVFGLDGERLEARGPVLVGPGAPAPSPAAEPVASAAGQRGVLVGPGGATGVIGPYQPNFGRGRQRSVLVGPGGPTGVFGPGYGGAVPGLLVGPGGPSGVIGPGRQLLTGPGGPTGSIGPRRFFGN